MNESAGEGNIDEPVEDTVEEIIDIDKEDLDLVISNEDWRKDLPDDVKEDAKRHDSVASLIRSNQTFRKRESQVRVPGKNASDEEVASYRKAIGVPETAELYQFPSLPEGIQETEQLKQSRSEWAGRFLDLDIPVEKAKALSEFVSQDEMKIMTAQVDADKTFVNQEEDALKNEWGSDFDKNKALANRAFSDIAERSGVSIDELTKIELKDGRFLMDRADMSRMFSLIGREMGEGSLGALSSDDRDTVHDEINEVRKQIQTAQAEGDSNKANVLFQKEQSLISRITKKETIVGNGRNI